MSIEGLNIIGESINASIPSTEKRFEEGDIEGIRALAQMQAERGADYIDVNVGRRPPEFMAEMVQMVQSAIDKPLSVDTPDPTTAEAGLKAYDPIRAGGAKPVLNSVSPLRLEMLDLYERQPFMPILMVSERIVDGRSVPNTAAEDIHATAKAMIAAVRDSGHGITNEECIFDPGIPSLGADMDGATNALLDALALMQADPDLAGCHVVVGLSNLTNMLPAKCSDGSPVRSPLESAFLTKAMPLGLDFVIGSVKRKYRILAEDHPALVCLEEVLELKGPDRLQRLIQYYA